MPFFPTFKQAVAVKSTGEVLGLEGSELYDWWLNATDNTLCKMFLES